MTFTARASSSAGAGLTITAVLLGVVHVTDRTALAGTATYLLGIVAASVVAWIGWSRQADSGRRLAALVASACTVMAGAELAAAILRASTGQQPAWALVGGAPLLAYVLLIAAVLGFGNTDRRVRLDIDGLIDLVATLIVTGLIVAELSERGILAASRGSADADLIQGATLALDAALLVVLLRAIVVGRLHRGTGSLVCLAVACWGAADVGAAFDRGAGWKPWIEAGWLFGAVALGAALMRPARFTAAMGTPGPLHTSRIITNQMPFIVPWAIEIYDTATGGTTHPLRMALATAAMMICLGVRARRFAGLLDQQQASLAAREHYYRVLSATSSDAVAVLDREGRLLNECPQIAEMFGMPELAHPGGLLLNVLSDSERERMASGLDWLWRTPKSRTSSDVHVVDVKGRAHWFHVRAVNLRDDPAVGAVVVNFSDVSKRKRAEDELAHHAFHDTLTGLPNRALFRLRVEQTLGAASTSAIQLAVMFLDVDGFKGINDRFGHAIGDEFLVAVAARLTDCVGPGDTVARLGGDEFAILLERPANALDGAVLVADRILASLAVPLVLDDQRLRTSASIGIAVSVPGATQATILRDADIAMYRSKTAGKNRWTVYDDAMRAEAVDRMELELELAQAVERQQLRLVYHPIVELATREVVGFETLLRWDHPTRGEIGPDVFIPIAESTGSIVAIGDWVIEQACRARASWRSGADRRLVSIGVNLSARQLCDDRIVARIHDALDRYGVEPEALLVEMTESVLVEDAKAATSTLGRLRALGIRVAVDDFGTGYSSLSYLRQFPIDVLKIDRSFVGMITDDGEVPAIVRGLLDLGRTLGLCTIAEGIESDGQLQGLLGEQCQFGQGFLFSRPLEEQAAAELVAQIEPDASVPLIVVPGSPATAG